MLAIAFWPSKFIRKMCVFTFTSVPHRFKHFKMSFRCPLILLLSFHSFLHYFRSIGIKREKSIVGTDACEGWLKWDPLWGFIRFFCAFQRARSLRFQSDGFGIDVDHCRASMKRNLNSNAKLRISKCSVFRVRHTFILQLMK